MAMIGCGDAGESTRRTESVGKSIAGVLLLSLIKFQYGEKVQPSICVFPWCKGYLILVDGALYANLFGWFGRGHSLAECNKCSGVCPFFLFCFFFFSLPGNVLSI